jgi:hypothetical protein
MINNENSKRSYAREFNKYKFKEKWKKLFYIPKRLASPSPSNSTNAVNTITANNLFNT